MMGGQKNSTKHLFSFFSIVNSPLSYLAFDILIDIFMYIYIYMCVCKK